MVGDPITAVDDPVGIPVGYLHSGTVTTTTMMMTVTVTTTMSMPMTLAGEEIASGITHSKGEGHYRHLPAKLEDSLQACGFRECPHLT